MPRKKVQSATTDVKGTQQVIPVNMAPAQTSSLAPVLNPSADDLIAEYNRNEDWMAAESKRFAEHTKPVVDRQEAIKSQLLERLNAEGLENIRSDHGTAYKSRILNTKIDAEAEPYIKDGQEMRGREALLDYALDFWDEIGNELLIVNAQKDAVKAHIEKHGKPPPGISTSTFVRLNIRRS